MAKPNSAIFVNYKRSADVHSIESGSAAAKSLGKSARRSVCGEATLVKIADSTRKMWELYSECRLRDFAHGQ